MVNKIGLIMLSFSEYLDTLHEKKADTGSFVSINISPKSKEEIFSFIKELKLPNHTKKSDLHITLIYSKKTIDKKEWKNGKIAINETAAPIKLGWLGDDNDCLVILLKSDYLTKRNKYITKTYGAISDYDKYTPHITLAYNLENYSIPSNIKLPNKLELVEEYYNDLEEDWADNK